MIDVSNVSEWCEGALVGLAIVMHTGHTMPPPEIKADQVISYAVKRPKGSLYAANGFLEVLPPNYRVGKTRAPLLIAFHGRGENGPGTATSLGVLEHTGVLAHWSADRPFVLLAPQHDGVGCPTAGEVADFIQFAKSNYQVDSRRIYLTGLSCGARGVADYLAHFGGKEITATVLIAGDLSPVWSAKECSVAREVPIWAMHGDRDDIVPDIGDLSTMKHFMSCDGHLEMKYDSYPAIGHDSWTRGYQTGPNHDVFDWLLQHVRGDDRTASAE